MRNYSHVVKAVYNSTWAILPATFDVILSVLDRRIAGEVFSAEEIQARLEEAAASNGPRRGPRNGAVAVIPMYGVISHRASMMEDTSGGTSLESVTAAFRNAMNDPDVSSILFDVDSPGGTVDGVEEFASEIRAARGGAKPIVAIANATAASAAYYAISGCDEIVCTPSGQVGSIGVIAAHVEDSKAREQAGINRTLIAVPPAKADGWDGDPMSDERLADHQAKANAYYGMFVNAVAKGRGVSPETVRSDFGGGWMLMAKEAQAAGMVDRVGTLDETVHRMSRGGVTTRPMDAPAALADAPPIADAAALASGLPYTQRLELALAEARDLAARSRDRAAMRAEAGRRLSADTRERLAGMAIEYGVLAAELQALATVTEPPASGDRTRALLAEARIRRARLLSATSTRS